MTKIENHKQNLLPFLKAYFKTNNTKNLIEYIVLNSNLPSPRANLELAKAFAELVEDFSNIENEKLCQVCSEFIEIPAEKAPTNDPKEFAPFCGAIGIGAVGSVSPQYFEHALSTLKIVSNDSRWRMREAVCFGLQRLLSKRGLNTLTEMEQWIDNGTLLELRAIAVAVAEPLLLKNIPFANRALSFHKQIMDRVQNTVDRKSEQFQILRKALGFTMSVVVSEIPDPGFEFMLDLANSKDPDLVWIVKENLKKNRLIKSFPEQVESLRKLV